MSHWQYLKHILFYIFPDIVGLIIFHESIHVRHLKAIDLTDRYVLDNSYKVMRKKLELRRYVQNRLSSNKRQCTQCNINRR